MSAVAWIQELTFSLPDSVSAALEAQILQRSHSMFADAMTSSEPQLGATIASRRILVIGAAGSIGQAFVHQLVRYHPALVHLVDLSENALVELVRDLRSSEITLPRNFETFAIDFGSSAFEHLIRTRGPYDVLVNFAAMKHVRSERNVESLVRMIDTNVTHLYRCLRSAFGLKLERAFSVSTDKTVRPASIMGATKNLMEKALFAQGSSYAVSTARFANVAFSNGSLLQGFGQRLAKGQPIAAPVGVKRYFISHREAGELCLLACFLGATREVFFPDLDAESDLIELPDVARRYLAFYGMRAVECSSERDAKACVNRRPGEWPCYFSPSDTSGEKSFEEFFRREDEPDYSIYPNIGIVRENAVDADLIERFLSDIKSITSREPWSKDAIIAAIMRAVPELDHVELHRNLDQKM